MPKRMSIREIDASEVQGEGALVTLRSLTLKEIKSIRDADDIREAAEKASKESGEEITELPPSSADVTIELVAKSVVKWNWVDENDEPLPQVLGHIEVIDDLLAHEIKFLVDSLVRPNTKK